MKLPIPAIHPQQPRSLNHSTTATVPGLQGSAVPGSAGGTVSNGTTYREVVKVAGASSVAVRIKTATATGTLTVTPIRLIGATPADESVVDASGYADPTKVTKYGTGSGSASVSAGTEASVTLSLNGEAYVLVEFACTADGTITYCDVATLHGGGSGGSGSGGAVTVADGADVTLGATTDAAVTGDNNGTVNAHLRGLAKSLSGTGTAYDSTNQRLKTGITDGTNYMPTMDAVGRPGFQKLTDGTTVVGVDASTQGLNVNVVKDSTTPSGSKSTVAQVSVATTAGGTLILAANASRKSLAITNQGAATIYLGNSGVTTATGFALAAGATISDVTTTDAWYGIVASGTVTAGVIEVS